MSFGFCFDISNHYGLILLFCYSSKLCQTKTQNLRTLREALWLDLLRSRTFAVDDYSCI